MRNASGNYAVTSPALRATTGSITRGPRATMSSRFPDYRPSTALRQAIEALRQAQKERRDSAAQRLKTPPHPGQSQGGPHAHTLAPGREGTGSGAQHGGKKDAADALTSGRKSGDDG